MHHFKTTATLNENGKSTTNKLNRWKCAKDGIVFNCIKPKQFLKLIFTLFFSFSLIGVCILHSDLGEINMCSSRHLRFFQKNLSSILNNIMLSNERTCLLFENEYYQSVVWTAKLLSSLWWLILFTKMKRNEWIGTEQMKIEKTNDGNKYGTKERKKKSYEFEWHYESARIVWVYAAGSRNQRELIGHVLYELCNNVYVH